MKRVKLGLVFLALWLVAGAAGGPGLSTVWAQDAAAPPVTAGPSESAASPRASVAAEAADVAAEAATMAPEAAFPPEAAAPAPAVAPEAASAKPAPAPAAAPAPALSPEAAAALREAQDRAALLARNKKYAEAAVILDQLHRQYPQERGVLYDYVSALAWGGQYEQAAQLAADMPVEEAPQYALGAAALAQRHSGRLVAAEHSYRAGLSRFPQDRDFAVGLALTLAEGRRVAEAREALKTAGPAESSQEVADAAAYIDRRAADYQRDEAEQQAAVLRSRQDQAVLTARGGNYDAALTELGELRQERPDDQKILADYLTVASWAGWEAEVADLAPKLDPKAAPEYALASVASSYRKTSRLNEAKAWYEEALARFPDNLDLRLGLAMTLGELKAPKEGLALLQKADAAKAAPEDQKRLAEARVYLQRMIPPPPPLPPYELPARAETFWRADQDRALELAREGRLDEALAILAELNRQHPRDPYLLSDYMVLLQWVPDHDQVLALSKNFDLKLVPAYGVIAVANTLVAKRDYYQARQYLEAALRAQRRRPELLAMSAQLVAMHGDFFRAVDWLDEAEASRIPGLGHLTEGIKRAIGYARVKSLRDLEAANRRLLARPRDGQALWLKTVALSGVGGAHEARSLINSGVRMKPTEIHNIKWAAGRKESRWGEQISDIRALDVHNRWFETSLASLRRLAFRPDCVAEDGCQTRALQATVQPLYQLNRLAEATEVYETTRAAGEEPTDAVLLSAGGAYLGQRQPVMAFAPYQEMVDRRDRVDPPVRADDVYEAQKGLFWASLESEQLQQARQRGWDLNEEMVSPPAGRPRVADVDWRKPDSLNVAGQAELFTGWTGNAEDHFDEFLGKAPANPDALASRSMTRSMRSLPRGAWRDAVVARLHDPNNLGLAIREAHALMDLNEWEAAHELITALAPWSPYNESVKQLERRWETHNLREFRLWTDWSKSDSDSPGVIGNTDLPSLNWRLYSQPLHYNWRAFIGSGWDSGEFQEGTAHQEIVLGGIEYRGRDLEATLEARADRVEDGRFGLGLSGVYEYDDHWNIPFSFQKLSPETPLRARHSDITADSAMVGAGYYWNDYRWLDLAANYMDFSDGNQRWAFGGTFNQRLWTWYTHYINGHLNFGTSRNSEDAERPYFNPEEDRELGLALTYGSVLWRCYERVWGHAITVGAGDYWQKYYGSDVIWNAGYSQYVDWDDRFSVAYGGGVSRRVYDGDPERDLNAFLNLVWKF